MAKKYLDRVSVSQDDNGAWWLEFYVDDIREAVLVSEIACHLLEEKEKEADRQFWEENYPHWKGVAFDLGAGKLTAAEQSMHLTDGTLAYLQALSTLQQNPNPEHSLIPPIRK